MTSGTARQHGPEEARERLSGVIDATRRDWSGQRVVMAVHKFNGGMKALAEELGLSGAQVAAVVINTRPAPGDPAVEHVWSCAEHGLEMTQRQFEEWLLDPPQELLDWLDGLDPEHSWHALGTTYAQFTELGGRPAYGRWRPEWTEWEDKTRIDGLWPRVGIPAPDHTVCGIDDEELITTAVRLDRGHGVMLAIDTTHAVLGSSQGLRWVRSRAELDAAVAELRPRTDRVRIASFVPGVPCSLMGMVLPDGVAVFDPIEVITLHRPETGTLVYCGTSTHWRPEERQLEQLREYARAAGREMAESLGYVGVFSVDGLASEHGFAATELNPRHVSGIGVRPGWPEFPTRLLNRAVQQGADWTRDFGWRDVEDAYRDVVRGTPSCSLWLPLPEGADPGAAEGDGASVPVRLPDDAECVVRYRPQCGGVWIDGTEDGKVPGDGALGPVTAALARELGDPELRSFAEVTLASTLAQD